MVYAHPADTSGIGKGLGEGESNEQGSNQAGAACHGHAIQVGPLDAGDGEAAARAAHPLKSSSAQLGGMLAASLAKEIESLARNGDLEALPPLADSLEVAIEDLMEALAAADFGASDA